MKHNITVIKPKLNGQAMTVIIDGVKYNSFNETPVSDILVRKYRKETNCSLEEAIDHVLCKAENKKLEAKNRWLKEIEKQKINFESHKFIYNNVTYKNFASAIRRLNKKIEFFTLNASSIITLAKKENISKQEAIDLFLERKKICLERDIKY